MLTFILNLLTWVGAIFSIVLLTTSFNTIHEIVVGYRKGDQSCRDDYEDPLFWKFHTGGWVIFLPLLIFCITKIVKMFH